LNSEFSLYMKNNHAFVLTLVLSTFLLVSCSKSEDEEYIAISPVSVNLATVPYAKLSEYHFLMVILKIKILH